MAKLSVRHLVIKPGAEGDRYYWQPPQKLRGAGWKLTRLKHPDGAPITDQVGAITAAEAKNAEVDAWRLGSPINEPRPSGVKPPPPTMETGTVDYGIRKYKASRFYLDKADKTKSGYDNNLKVISNWAGKSPIAAIDTPRINKFYEELRPRTPSKAYAMVVMMRVLFRAWIPLDLARSNPARDVPVSMPPPRGLIWPREAVLHLVKTADGMGRWSIGTAMIIQHWIGQREGDLLSLERSRYRDGAFFVFQSKRGARVRVNQSPLVGQRIEEELARQDARKIVSTKATTLIISEETGRPYTQSNFQHRFADVRAEAAETKPAFETDYILDIDGEEIDEIRTEQLLFSWMRHTAVTELATSGCDAPAIASITGQSIQTCQNIIDRYLFPTGATAAVAVQKRLEWEQKSNQSLTKSP